MKINAQHNVGFKNTKCINKSVVSLSVSNKKAESSSSDVLASLGIAQMNLSFKSINLSKKTDEEFEKIT